MLLALRLSRCSYTHTSSDALRRTRMHTHTHTQACTEALLSSRQKQADLSSSSLSMSSMARCSLDAVSFMACVHRRCVEGVEGRVKVQDRS